MITTPNPHPNPIVSDEDAHSDDLREEGDIADGGPVSYVGLVSAKHEAMKTVLHLRSGYPPDMDRIEGAVLALMRLKPSRYLTLTLTVTVTLPLPLTLTLTLTLLVP